MGTHISHAPVRARTPGCRPTADGGFHPSAGVEFRSLRRGCCSRSGFTLTQLLVVISIIAVLIALLLPAVLHIRAAARKTQCSSNMRELGLAIRAYHAVHEVFPPGSSSGYPLHVFLLPYIERENLYQRADFSGNSAAQHAAQHAMSQIRVPLFLCPSDPVADTRPLGGAPTNYAGCFGSGVQTYGFNGMFQHLVPKFLSWKNGPVRELDVPDGLSNTVAMGEHLIHRKPPSRLRTVWETNKKIIAPTRLDDFAAACRSAPAGATALGPFFGVNWVDAGLGETMYNHILRPNEPSCQNGSGGYATGAYTAGSMHPGGGAHVVYGDAHVQFVSEEVDVDVWRAMASRDGADDF